MIRLPDEKTTARLTTCPDCGRPLGETALHTRPPLPVGLQFLRAARLHSDLIYRLPRRSCKMTPASGVGF